ncbi:hypothetical protein VNO77_17644 [Canavalia gladiata]|uniref:Uncharacterized protein n=1 Tax=Canavalia gladiata TaxID=3824 RepID=A0AAN9QGT7_CANGL
MLVQFVKLEKPKPTRIKNHLSCTFLTRERELMLTNINWNILIIKKEKKSSAVEALQSLRKSIRWYASPALRYSPHRRKSKQQGQNHFRDS